MTILFNFLSGAFLHLLIVILGVAFYSFARTDAEKLLIILLIAGIVIFSNWYLIEIILRIWSNDTHPEEWWKDLNFMITNHPSYFAGVAGGTILGTFISQLFH